MSKFRLFKSQRFSNCFSNYFFNTYSDNKPNAARTFANRFVGFITFSIFLTLTAFFQEAFADIPSSKITANNLNVHKTLAPKVENSTLPLVNYKVNLNIANAKDLIKVKGLNAARVRAIIAYRKKHGSFKNTEELMNVKGFKRIKVTTRKAIEEQLTV